MDLTYMPGELDMKNSKKGNGTDMKRDHDSVDDFEHLDPDLSPGDGHVKEKFDLKDDGKDHNIPADLIEKSHGDPFGLPSKPGDSESGKISPDSNLLSDFGVEGKQIKTEVDFHFDSEGKSSLLDFGISDEKSVPELDEKFNDEHSITKSFISAEIATNRDKTDHETPILDVKSEIITKEKQESHTIDENVKSASDNVTDLIDKSEHSNSKSMKEDDALPQYETKLERTESPPKDDYLSGTEKELGVHEPEYPKPHEVSLPAHIEQTIIPEPEDDSHEDMSEFMNTKDFGSPKEFKETLPVEEPSKPEPTAKPAPPVSKDTVKSAEKKTTISDLDDIIGPEDVFKRIGLDAWFTPERLHPKVEALVYWRDPKKSGVVFGGGMAILLSLCFMSLISVIAYTSLFTLAGTICFRIYKNILQAVQKTSEGHPFKEFLELELSLPQDKVREVVDTAVVHVNAGVVELRRLFLVEDLIDSIKFGVCLWCLTYVGAIFNGMTLVILAFVALFTVPKIYENNKASIDQYIEVGRSKVAEITSKVKAAVPLGKKEPEKDKEQ